MQDGFAVEMIVVVVADEHAIDVGKIGKGNRRIVPPFEGFKRDRRAISVPNGIGEYGKPFQLNEKSRVADPESSRQLPLELGRQARIREVRGRRKPGHWIVISPRLPEKKIPKTAARSMAVGVRITVAHSPQNKDFSFIESHFHDYMCDRSSWGVELVKRVGSDNFKLLYDIYHMQIMEGDVIRTIRQNHTAFGHYHTGGNPGRNELDDTQELTYKAIARAIADVGFQGYMAHEFIPLRDPLTSLGEAVELCVV